MSKPFFRPNALTDGVPRRGATSHKAGFDQYRRVDNLERGFTGQIANDTDELNLYRALGSTVLTYNFDPGWAADATNNAIAVATGFTYFHAVYLPQAATATGVGVYVQTAGIGTWTTGRVGLYSTAGVQLAASTNDTALWKATGISEKAFTSTYAAEKGLYYIALNNTRSVTTTAPKLAARNSFASTLANIRTSASYPRSSASADTALSTPYTLSASTLQPSQFFVYLY